jgi:hypothetical protein
MGVTDGREEHVRDWIMESRDLVFYNILLPSPLGRRKLFLVAFTQGGGHPLNADRRMQNVE